MRLAYVINSLEAGGAQFPIPRIVAGLRERGVETTVYSLSTRDGLSIPKLEAVGVPYRRAPFAKTAHLKAARWLRAELRRDRPDALWTSLTQATLIGQRVGSELGLPVISWQHNAFLKRANRFLLRRQVGMSRFWIADSESVADFTHASLGVSADNIAVLPLFVANPDAPQAKPALEGPVRIVSVGRLHRNKNYDGLIEALSRTELEHQWTLHIAGDGKQRENLDILRQDWDHIDDVILHGHVTDIPAFLASGDLYVQSSLNEGLCIAAHEAMAAGLPCVVTETGQMPLTLGDAGWTAEATEQLGPLAIAIKAAFHDRTTWRDRGATARQRVLERFDQARFDAALDAIVARLRDVVRM